MRASLATYILFHATTMFSQSPVVLTETVIANQLYGVHSIWYSDNEIENTSNIYVFKGTPDTIWLYGVGYGDGESTSGSLNDARKIFEVVNDQFNASPSNCHLAVIYPFVEWDSTSDDLVLQLLKFGFTSEELTIYARNPKILEAIDSLVYQAIQPLPEDSLSRFMGTITTAYGHWDVLESYEYGLSLCNQGLQLTTDAGCLDYTVLPFHGDIMVFNVPLGDYQTQSGETVYLNPNPITESATFYLPNAVSPWKLIVTNSEGETILETSTQTDQLTLAKGSMNASSYRFELWQNDSIEVSGKFKVR